MCNAIQRMYSDNLFTYFKENKIYIKENKTFVLGIIQFNFRNSESNKIIFIMCVLFSELLFHEFQVQRPIREIV